MIIFSQISVPAKVPKRFLHETVTVFHFHFFFYPTVIHVDFLWRVVDIKIDIPVYFTWQIHLQEGFD